MKASRFAIGTIVNSKKGNGIITKIITQSTGYVEVTLSNGTIIKEMAFNMTDENGESLKKKPTYKPTEEQQKRWSAPMKSEIANSVRAEHDVNAKCNSTY